MGCTIQDGITRISGDSAEDIKGMMKLTNRLEVLLGIEVPDTYVIETMRDEGIQFSAYGNSLTYLRILQDGTYFLLTNMKYYYPSEKPASDEIRLQSIHPFFSIMNEGFYVTNIDQGQINVALLGAALSLVEASCSEQQSQ